MKKQIIPETYSYHAHHGDWLKFLSACLLYDPPDTKLDEFAAYGDPAPVTTIPPPLSAVLEERSTANAEEEASNTNTDSASGMVAPPIKVLRDPDKVQEDATWYWHQIIDEIGKQFLQPMGLDVWDLVEQVKYREPRPGEEFWGPKDEYDDRVLRNEPRPYIFVSKETTEEDVKKALQMIKGQLGPSSKGRPPRDRLTAIQCAIFSNHYGWSEKDIAERYGEQLLKRSEEGYGWTSEDASEKYIEYGMELLS